MITIPVSIITLQLFILLLQAIVSVNAYVKKSYLLACIASFGLGFSIMSIIDEFKTVVDKL
jgi:hypothetical protein